MNISVTLKRDIENNISKKDNEIRLLQNKIDEARRNHIENMNQLQKTFLENKRFAEQWKDAAETTAFENENELRNLEEEIFKSQQLSSNLDNEINNVENEINSMNQILIKKEQDIKSVQQEIEQLEIKKVDQDAELQKLKLDQINFANEREKLLNEIDEYKSILKKQKKK